MRVQIYVTNSTSHFGHRHNRRSTTSSLRVFPKSIIRQRVDQAQDMYNARHSSSSFSRHLPRKVKYHKRYVDHDDDEYKDDDDDYSE